jgi:uncharacterized protein YecE (DUF72 family)
MVMRGPENSPRGYSLAEGIARVFGASDGARCDSWYAMIPPGPGEPGRKRRAFIFAAKVPQVITHEKVLRDCQPELGQFLSTMNLLGEKLGPLLLQFGYFNKKAFPDLDTFLARLVPFLKALQSGYRFALEIRNRNWFSPKLADVLRERGIALALIDQAWMPRPAELFERFPSDDGPITADFTYIRWLGDRKGIERLTKT